MAIHHMTTKLQTDHLSGSAENSLNKKNINLNTISLSDENNEKKQ